MLDHSKIKSLPKVLLHDHLDGGLRPQTIIDIANEIGYKKLPTQDASQLKNWFRDSADSGSLVEYLETFAHTVAVMQRKEDLIRVAREAVLDLAADGVVYAEIRYAPELHTEAGLTISQVIESVTKGFKLGMAEAKTIRVESLLCGMRQNKRSYEIAEYVIKYLNDGVVGFDIAGPEIGFPPTNQQRAFDLLTKSGAHFTIHAGEALGPESIAAAINYCLAQRIGHGVRIIEDIDLTVNPPKFGDISAKVKAEQIPLEVCPSSNIQTGIAKTIADHPIDKLKKLGFCITVNTDNRLMSGTSMSEEFDKLAENFGWGIAEFKEVTLNAAKNAFISADEKAQLTQEILNRFA